MFDGEQVFAAVAAEKAEIPKSRTRVDEHHRVLTGPARAMRRSLDTIRMEIALMTRER